MDFFKDKRVLVMGHTGFKGSWLCVMLQMAGAKVAGFSLKPPESSLFEKADVGTGVENTFSDVRDAEKLYDVFKTFQPEIVFHLAAQPLVRESYEKPAYTYEVNVMGTVNILECVRKTQSVRSFLNITTDKVYRNNEWHWGYREEDTLDGFDPYSSSKSCSELVTSSYIRSFFQEREIAVSTARAGNVIGGGDFAADRILPDCVRAVSKGGSIMLRNPHSVRPYQHVLDALNAYLVIAQKQYENKSFAGTYNIGPSDDDCVTTKALAEMFCEAWGEGARYETASVNGPHEANFLKLDTSKIKADLGWCPRWNINTAVQKTVEWVKNVNSGQAAKAVMESQIADYFGR